MIQLHTDCLVFETSDGEAIPCSAHDVTVELLGDAVTEIEPHLITEAAEANPEDKEALKALQDPGEKKKRQGMISLALDLAFDDIY